MDFYWIEGFLNKIPLFLMWTWYTKELDSNDTQQEAMLL